MLRWLALFIIFTTSTPLLCARGEPDVSFNVLKIRSFFQPTLLEVKDDEMYSLYGNYLQESSDVDSLIFYNRPVFRVNMWLNNNFFGHIAKAYSFVPPEIRGSLDNMYLNINRTPTTLFYSLLELDMEAFMITAWRFMINSTLGVLGLFDVSGMFGVYPVSKGADQFLSSYGLISSHTPFFVVPILGPSTIGATTEFVAYIVLSFYNPYFGVYGFGPTYSLAYSFLGPNPATEIVSRYFTILYAPKFFNLLANLDFLLEEVNNNSVDGYVSIRTFFLKNLKHDISKEQEKMLTGRLQKTTPIQLSHLSRYNNLETEESQDKEHKEDAVYNFGLSLSG